MFNGFNLTAEDLLAGQDPKGLVMCFFKHSDRVRIRAVRINGIDYRGGRLVAPLIDPETGCTPAEMGETLLGPITIKPIKLTTPGSARRNGTDQEVA